MFRRKSKIFGLIALAVAFTFMFSAVASAAVPVNLYFKSGDEMVKVDYAKAVSDAQDEDSTLYEAVVEKIGEAEGSGAAVVVETDEGIFLDWQKALMKSARFAEIVDDETYKTAKPEYTKELQVKDGEAIIDDPIGEIVDDALKVISVSDIDAVEVEFGASIEDVMALLPPTVTATLNNEEATEVELEINWEENGNYNGEEAGDYVFEGALVAEEDAEYTIPEEYAAVEVTVTVLEEGAVELKVVEVSAINDIEVEFGGEVVLPEMATIVLSDESEVEVPVTWEGEYDVNIAGTYELVGTLDLSALENVAATELTASVNVVVAEYVDTEAPVITLNGEAEVNLEFGAEYVEEGATAVDNIDGELEVTIEGTVDTSVAGTYTITYTATDAAGNVATATRIVVVAEEVRIPSTLTTEAEATINAVVGNKISIVYTVQDENEKPVIGTDVRVRATAGFPVTVEEEQVLTTDENGQVTFAYTSVDGRQDAIQAVVLEKPTLRNTAVTVEWVETAATVTVENPAAKGFIVDTATNIDVELQAIKYVATFKDENGEPLADGKVVSVDLTGVTGTLTAGTDDEFTATAGNVCTATLANGDGTAVLEFTAGTAQEIEPLFFYSAEGNAWAGTGDPRAKGAKVELLNGDTQEPTFTLELKEGDNVNTDVIEVDGEYNVVDTKDIIFVLTAKDQYGNPFIGTANLNNKVHLDDLAGNDNLPGEIQFAYAEEDGAFTTATSNNVTFSPTVDANGNGVIEIKVNQSVTSVGDTTNLVVWVDVNANGKYDAGEGVESAKITFVEAEAPVVASMKATADATAVIADGTNYATYTVELLGADGKAFDTSGTNNVDVIVKIFKDGKEVDQSVAGVVAIGGTAVSVTPPAKVATGTITVADGKFTFTLTPVATEKGSSIYPVVYVDLNGDGVVQADEKVSVQGEAFTAIAEPNDYKLELSATKLTAGDQVSIKLTAQDSASKTETKFNGEFVVGVEILDSTTSTLKTYLRKANFVDGVATVSVPVELVASNKIKATMPEGSTPDVTSTETLTVKAAEASSKLAVDTTAGNALLVADKFGNTAEYNFTGLATVTNVDGTFGATLVTDAENQVQIKIVNGAVKNASDVAVTFNKDTGKGKATLTLELANGGTFSVTVK